MRSVSSVLAVSTNRWAIAVRSRTLSWNLDGGDAGPGQGAVEGGGGLAGTVADEEPEGLGAVVEVHQQVAGLLGGPGSGRVAGRPEDVDVAAADFHGEEDVDPFRLAAKSTWKKSTARIVEACVRRNRRHVVSVVRHGAGGMRRRLRILRIVEAATR